MNVDAIGDAERGEIFAREAYMRRIEFNRVDDGPLGAMGEPERRIAERTAEFEHAFGCNGGGDHAEDRAVRERIGAATVLRAVPQRLRAHLAVGRAIFFGPCVLSLPDGSRGGDFPRWKFIASGS